MDPEQPVSAAEVSKAGQAERKDFNKEKVSHYWEMMRRAGYFSDDQGDDEEGEDR